MSRKIVLIAAGALAILHQDFWLWDDTTLVFGFLPIGLAYHAAYSLAAALLWFLALRYAWPEDIIAFAEGAFAEAGAADGDEPESTP